MLQTAGDGIDCGCHFLLRRSNETAMCMRDAADGVRRCIVLDIAQHEMDERTKSWPVRARAFSCDARDADRLCVTLRRFERFGRDEDVNRRLHTCRQSGLTVRFPRLVGCDALRRTFRRL